MWKNRKMEWMLLSVAKMLDFGRLVRSQSFCNICCMLAFFLVPFSMSAYLDSRTNFLRFTIDSRRAIITGFSGSYSRSNLLISKVRYNNQDYSVKAIASNAFENCKDCSSITIDDGIEIGEKAFYRSTIKSVTIGDNCKIGAYAFYWANVESVFLGDNCEIGQMAFSESNLTEVGNRNILSGVQNVVKVGFGSFTRCKRLKKVWPQLSEIGISAFSGCDSLTYVVFSDSLKNIGERVFKDCHSLSSVHFPDGLTSIGESAFKGCNLKSVDIPYNVNVIGESAFGYNQFNSVFVPYNVDIGFDAFENTMPKVFVGKYFLKDNMGDAFTDPYNGYDSLYTFIGGTPMVGRPEVDWKKIKFKSLSFFGWQCYNSDVYSNENFAIHFSASLKELKCAPILNNPIGVNTKVPNIVWCNIPEVKNTIAYTPTETGTTFFVESDTLHLKTSLKNGDRLVCVNPLGTTIIFDGASSNNVKNKCYGDFKNGVKNREVFDIDSLRYYLLCAPIIVVDSINANYESYYKSPNRKQLDDAFYALFPFKKFFDMSYAELTKYYNTLSSAFLKMFGKDLDTIYSEKALGYAKSKLQSLRDSCDRIAVDGVYPYIDAEKRKSFNDVLTTIPTQLDRLTLNELKEAYSALAIAYDSIMPAFNSYKEMLQKNKASLQVLFDESSELNSTSLNIYPYIDAEKKNAFTTSLSEAGKALDDYDNEKVVTAQSNLQVAYDSIAVIINRYNSTLNECKNQLQTLVDNSSELGKTMYIDIYPYIDNTARSALSSALTSAQSETVKQTYDVKIVQSALTQLQSAYDTIVVVINRYNSTLEESKNQLQALVDNSNKLGKTIYADIYPYIDNTAKGALSSALTSAQSETVKQSYDVEKIQSAQVKLQSAYDQVIALLNTYNDNLTSAKQTLQQQIDTEGTLKSMGEFAFIDANLQKAYEDALTSATTAVSGYDVAAINGAADPLHQAYVNAKNAINSIANELAPAKSILQSQIDKGNAYLENKPYYFTANYISKLQSRIAEAKNVLSNADISSLRQEITILNNLFAELETVITYYKAKEAEMNARFERIYALMDTLKTIGLYDEEGNIIHPAGDIKGMNLFQFDGTNYSYNRCLEVVRQAQSLAAYAGPSDSGFDESGINDYKNKCNDFIDRFNAEFGVLQAKYQAEREKLREMVQKLQKIKDDNPAAYAAIDNALREKVETQISEWSNAEGYAEVGNAYANADFSLSDELQEAIASYNSVVNELSVLIANVSDDCRRIANGASMNAVNTRSDYRKGDGILTSESQITISGNNSKSALLDSNVNTEVKLMSSAKTIDLDLNKTYTNVVLAFGYDRQSSLTYHFNVYATNAPQDVDSWKLQGEFDNTYDRKSQQKYVAKQFVGFDDNYRYLRIEFVPTAECPQTYIAELRVYHRANKFEGEGDEACTQFFHSLAELKAQQESGNISVEKAQQVRASYNRFDAFEENNDYATADFKETPSVTCFNANKAMTLPNEVVGSIITSKNGRIVRDARYDESHPVPANTAVVLEGMGGCSYYLKPTTDYVASIDGNLLHGMLADGTTQVLEGEAKYYQFSKGTFAWAKENGAPFSAKAGDVYLAIPTGMEQLDAYDFSSIYGIGDDVPPYTGINELQGLSKRKGVFDLNGRPIKVNDSRELMPGVYIVDGKKIVVK